MQTARMIRAALAAATLCVAAAATPPTWAAAPPPAGPTTESTKSAPAAETPKPAAPANVAAETKAAPAPAAPTPAAAAKTAAPETAKAPASAEFRFQFDGIPYDDIIRRFAQMIGKPILGDVRVEGQLTFFDSKPYTLEEAFDMLNLLLAMRGQTLIETPRYMQVVPIKDFSRYPTKIIHGTGKVEGIRPGEMVTMMIPLKFVSGDEAAKMLSPLVSVQGTLAPMGRGRGLIITDRLQNIQRIRTVLDGMDSGEIVSPTERVMKCYVLKYASARDLANIINVLFSGTSGLTSGMGQGGGYQSRYVRDEDGNWVRNPNYNPEGGGGEGHGMQGASPASVSSEGSVRATADERTNTLFLIGAGDKLSMAEEVIQRLDAVEPTATGDMRIFELKNARAEDIANTIRQLLPGQVQVTGGRYQQYQQPMGMGMAAAQGMTTRVVADPGTNRLIVTAPLDQMKRIEELVRQLDQASTNTGGMRVFRLKVADAQQLASVVAAAIRKAESPQQPGQQGSGRFGPGGVASTGPQVSADVRTNSLIVAGTATEIQAASLLIEELDRPNEKEPREIHVVQLKAGDAKQIAVALTQLFRQQEATGSGRMGGGTVASSIRVEAELLTNTLMISCAPGDWKNIQDILEQLKASAIPLATPTTRIVPLQFVKATEMADTLNQVFGPQARARSGGFRTQTPGAPQVPVVIAPSERSNSLLISAAEDDQKSIADLIKTMDVAGAEKADAMRIIHLKSGDAKQVADIIRSMQPPAQRGQPQQVYIQGDVASNSIVYRGPDTEFKIIEQMVTQLDQVMIASGGIKTFRLQVADAQQVAQVLQGALAKVTPGQRGQPGVPPTVVSADTRTNSVIISGPAADIQTAATLIAELDKPLDKESREIHVVQLKAGDAKQVAIALTQLLRQQEAMGRGAVPSASSVRVEAEPVTNSLMISSAPGDWPTIEKILTQLKEASLPLTMATTRMISLKHAKASELADTLKQVFSGQTASAARGRMGTTPGGPPVVPVVIAPSDRNNSLLVSASDDDQKTIAELVKSMDVAAPDGVEGIRMVRLQSADAVKLAESLKGMIPLPTKGQPQTIFIQADPVSNTVLLRAPESDRKMLEEMIAGLDKATQQQAREVRMINLKHISAITLTAMLTQLYQPASAATAAGPRRPGMSTSIAAEAERVIIAPAPGDRAIVVDAPRDKIEEIVQLVNGIDVADAPGQIQVRTYRLVNSKAVDIAAAMSRLFTQQQQRGGARPVSPETEPQPRFEADPATNQVMVAATPAQFQIIDELIKKLETGTSLARETKTYRLKFARATDLVDVLQTMLSETPAATGPGRRAEPSAAADVRVAAMADTNDVVVQGPPEKLALAEQLIKTFDAQEAAAQSSIQIVQLRNAQAMTMAAAINEALTERAAVAAPTAKRAGMGAGAAEKTERVTVTAEPNSNSVIIRGPSVDVPGVVQMIRSLDEGSRNGAAEVRVYPLENSEPAQLATALGKLFQDMVKQQASAAGKNAPPIPFSITADERTRSLVVSTTPSHFAILEQILKNLDQAPAAPTQDVQYFWLENADATEVASQLSDMYRDRKGADKPIVTPDSFANAITVIAKDAEIKAMEQVIAKLDDAAKENNFRVRVIPLTAVKADKMAEVLRAVYPQLSGGQITISTEPKPGENAPPPGAVPEIATPAAGAKSAPAKSEPAAKEKGGAAKEKGSGGKEREKEKRGGKDRAPREEGDGGEGGALFRAPKAQPGVTIAVDRTSNSLIVSGKRQDIDYLESLIQQLTPATGGGEAEFRIFKVEQADPGAIGRTLDALFNPKPILQMGKGGQPSPPPPPVITVVADVRTKSLIIRAKPLDFELIDPLVKHLDQIPTVISEVRIFTLKNTDAVEVASNLKDLFGLNPKQQPQMPQQPQQMGKDGRPVQDQRAAMVRQMLELQGKAGVTQVDAATSISITANRQTNSVVVAAPSDAMAIVARLIEELDQSGVAAAAAVRLYPVKNADVRTMVSELQEIFVTGGKQAGRGGGGFGPAAAKSPALEQPIVITGDEAGKIIIVAAPSDKHELISRVINEMDQAQAAGDMSVKVYHLQTADATTVATALAATVERSAGGGGKGAAAAGAGQVRISADRSSNSVVVRASAQEHEKIARIITDLDTAAPAVVRMYPLKNADVRSTVQALQDVFGGSKAISGGGKGGKGAGPELGGVVITGDEAGHLVIVSAPAERHELIVKVINEIDQAQGAGEVTVRIYRLSNAEATSVAAALQGTIERTAGPVGGGKGAAAASASTLVRISADRSSNCLVVRAPAEEHERIAKLVQELDIAPTDQYAVRLVPLANADAAVVAPILQKVFGGISAAGGGGKGAAAAIGPRAAVLIEADRDARMLMVRADDPTFEKIKALALQLDAASPQGQAAPTVIQLKFAQAASVAPALQQAFGLPKGAGGKTTVNPDDMVTVVAEPMSNSLIVTANAQNMVRVQALLAKLDTEAAGGIRTEMLVLKNARAVDVAPVLAKMAQATVMGGAAGKGGMGAAGGVAVSADAGSNAIVISGPAGDLEKVLKMAQQLDQVTPSQGANTFVIALRNGDANTVAQMVRDLYSQQAIAATREKRTIDPLAVSSEARSNTIVLSTTREMYEQVSQWVNQLEGMQPSRGAVRIITLQNADPAELDKAIKQIFGPASGPGMTTIPIRRGPGGADGPSGAAAQPPPGGKVETTVLPQQRSVLVNASDEDFETIKRLAEALDAAAADARRQVRVFALKNANNARVALALTGMYRLAGVPKVGVAATAEDVVTVTALPDTNAVVVSASKMKMEEVARLIEELDRVEIAPQLETRVIPLQNVQPTKIVPLVQQMIVQLKLTRPDEPINVQADERTRSLIVTARGPIFEQIEKIVRTLDVPPALPAVDVLILPLKRADATQLALVLTDMLRPSVTGQVTPEALALQQQIRLLRVHSAADADKVPELDLTKPIKITADPSVAKQQGSNSLVITSTPENLKAMKAIVELLDTVPVAEGVRVRVVHLQNADVTSVVTILKDVFTQGTRLAGRPKSSVEGKAEPESLSGRALVNPLNASADIRTNTLVMSGLEESLALADLLVKDLDREAGQIVTEVRLFRLKYADAAKMAPILQAVFSEAPVVVGTEGIRTQVTRLRTVLEKQQGHVSEIPKTRMALAIQADPTTSTIIVAARADVMPLVADVINTMDVAGAGSMNIVRIFPLVNADATRMKGVIDGLYVGPSAQMVRPEDKPVITVDTRTNALVVSTSDKTFAMVDLLLKTLDAKSPIEMRDVRLVPLKNADASGLAPILQQMMDARVQRLTSLGAADADAVKVIVIADARSNSLMVGGSPEGFDLVKTLAEQLDAAGPALVGQIQLLPLKHANAGTMAVTLTNLFNQRYQTAKSPDVQRQRPIILPDLRVNGLLIAANADDTKAIQGLLEKLDVELQDPSIQLTVIPMKFNDAGIVGPMIQQIFAARLTSMAVPGVPPIPQDRVDVAIEALTNSLIISASRENMALIRDLLAKVDVSPPEQTGVVRMYALQNSDAGRIASMLQGLIAQGLYKPGALLAQTNPLLAAREKVSIAVDARTNVLIISASRENFAVLEEILKKIDSTDDFTVLGDIRLFTLRNANATRLAPTLQQLFTAKRAAEVAAGATGRSLPVSIIPDARTNTLLVAGSRESFNAIEAMIRELDTDQVLAANEFRVFYLKQGTAAVMQPTLQQLFAARVARVVPNDPVTIVAEPRTNALIIAASPEDMKLAESLVARLDSEPDRPGTSVQVFTLVKADAIQVAATITSLYRVTGAPAGAPTVVVSTDERTNSVIVSAGAADLKRIADLVRQLDTDSVPRVTEIRVYTLQNADATELAQILSDSLNNRPKTATPVNPNRQSLLQFVTRSKDGGELISSALQEGVLITPDKRTNSIVVSAPVENMLLLSSIIASMDSTSPRTAEIRVFQLQNSDARQLATTLLQLFRMQATPGAGAAGKQAIQYTLKTPQGEMEKNEPAAVMGSAEEAALSVTVDIRTNSLLVGGTRHYVDLASKVIQELDASAESERLTEIYRLRNAQAKDIELAITAFLNQEKTLLTQGLGAGAGTTQYILDREVAIVAEPVTNTLLLSASPRYFDVIAQMVSELDQPPPQVLIQVLLAEVSIKDTCDFGMDWNLTGKVGDTTVSGGTKFKVQGAIGTLGGFNVQVTGDNITYFLRALATQNRLEVLSRPQILASDNQKATIQIGQRVPFITNSRISGDNNTVINTIQYQQIGIILEVTPRINPDGFVKMVVHPEISTMAKDPLEITPGVPAVIINSRSAETTVTVQDGHTIVIGGLITTTDSDIENKVPILGDIPLIGWLFKTTSKSKERTELLIILTPTVIRNVREADEETQGQVRRLKLLHESKHDTVQKSVFKTLGGASSEAGGGPTEKAQDTKGRLNGLMSPQAPSAKQAGAEPKEPAK